VIDSQKRSRSFFSVEFLVNAREIFELRFIYGRACTCACEGESRVGRSNRNIRLRHMMSSQDRTLVFCIFLLVFLGFTERACSSLRYYCFVGIPYAVWVRLTFVFTYDVIAARRCVQMKLFAFFLCVFSVFDAALF